MKRKMILLYTAYACLVIGLGIRQYKSYKDSFEVIVPYSHAHDITTETTRTTQEPITPTIAAIHETTESVPPESVPETVPVTEETTSADPTEGICYPLNLNTATMEELCTLPGIGEVTAQAICNYREEIGGFINRLQLMDVYGIGEGKYQQILSYVYLEQELPLPVPTEPEIILSEPPPEILLETEPLTEAPTIPVLNLNTVTKEELLLLPGCDEQIAENILYLRDELIHSFQNPMEMLLAEGVTDGLFLQWQPYLAVDDEGGTQLLPDDTN